MRYNLQNGRLVPHGQYILLKHGGTRPTPAAGCHVEQTGWQISGNYIVPVYESVQNVVRSATTAPSEIPILGGNTEMKIRVVTNKLGDKSLEVVPTQTQEQS